MVARADLLDFDCNFARALIARSWLSVPVPSVHAEQ
jgi:hypothetical protein